jgi:hypothetical protein
MNRNRAPKFLSALGLLLVIAGALMAIVQFMPLVPVVYQGFDYYCDVEVLARPPGAIPSEGVPARGEVSAWPWSLECSYPDNSGGWVQLRPFSSLDMLALTGYPSLVVGVVLSMLARGRLNRI